jgi:hypothetical protein
VDMIVIVGVGFIVVCRYSSVCTQIKVAAGRLSIPVVVNCRQTKQ